MASQEIDHGVVRYSQTSIEITFSDRKTSVETWIKDLPYNLALQVVHLNGEYLSLDNRRLYSAKTTCATQNSTFSQAGQLHPDPHRGSRPYDPQSFKIVPATTRFENSDDGSLESLNQALHVLVRVNLQINVYHERNDLRDIIVSPTSPFEKVRYEKSTGMDTLRARGETQPDSNGWNDLLAVLSETESTIRDEYEPAYFESLKVFCKAYEYNVPDYLGLSKNELRQKE
jgi:hypothetical protein